MPEANRINSIPADQKSSFTSFLKTLSSFTGDLSQLTCPSFFLAPESLLEYSSYWADQPDHLASAGNGVTEEERFYNAIKWFITALNGSFTSRVPAGEWEKKPFNPILGEQFFCQWENGTRAICEQVSHHPPVSAFIIENEASGVSITVNDAQKTRFSGTQMLVDQIGYCMLEMKQHGEKYLFSLPSISVQGIWYAAPYVELFGTSYIQSSTGFHAAIEYTTKGWIYGEMHHFKATVSHISQVKTPTVIEGQWSGKSTLKKDNQAAQPFLDVKEKARPPVLVKPISEQTDMESQKIWQKVSEALKAGDYATASAEKTRIENEQRAIRRERGDEDTWQPKYFEKLSSAELFGDLKDFITIYSNNKFVNTFDEYSWRFVRDR
ncbi:uncharacterized protein ATC70_002123 [Mucor velutinosus]|uniref:Oxysterol-binding protein n=1 Tax=Mucor velutinosus TaxID=708070 RepID=A0AAN7DES1_9FUNG|nr:hypothetical protein ATC70_002123 [Mucor velutinosus]